MIHGEAVVLRILDRGDTQLGTEHIGMAERDRDHFDKILDMPHGIVLVTGPTGSGKTTTLYAALTKINDVERKIITIEDPVEYQLRGVNQIQVNSKSGLSFAAGLRAILRHDPGRRPRRRNSRQGDGGDRGAGVAHWAPRVLHAAHERCARARQRDSVEMGIEPYLIASSSR
jgi:energy-coupling factor transporter ATP-binding protein EcfA2